MNIVDQIQTIADSSEYDLAYRSDYSGQGMNGNVSPLAFVTTIPPESETGRKLLALGLVVDTMGLSWIYYLVKA